MAQYTQTPKSLDPSESSGPAEVAHFFSLKTSPSPSLLQDNIEISAFPDKVCPSQDLPTQFLLELRLSETLSEMLTCKVLYTLKGLQDGTSTYQDEPGESIQDCILRVLDQSEHRPLGQGSQEIVLTCYQNGFGNSRKRWPKEVT